MERDGEPWRLRITSCGCRWARMELKATKSGGGGRGVLSAFPKGSDMEEACWARSLHPLRPSSNPLSLPSPPRALQPPHGGGGEGSKEGGLATGSGGPQGPGGAEWCEKGVSKVSFAFISPEVGSWNSVCLPARSPGQPLKSPWQPLPCGVKAELFFLPKFLELGRAAGQN